MTSTAALIERRLAEWGYVPAVLSDVCQTSEPAAMGSRRCVPRLGSAVADPEFFKASVGIVLGARLTDGRRVVLKVHRPRVSERFLAAVQHVQATLRCAGFAAPAPLGGPFPLEKVVRVHWKTLRAFDERHKLAKRLWLYLAAERWKKTGRETEGVWITCGDRIEAALGMDYERARDARAALKRACHTIRVVDPRYSAGELDVIKVGSSYRIQGSRPNWETWKVGSQEQLQIRDQIRRSIRGD